MNIREFKAWLDGYSKGIKGTPSKAEWEEVKKKLEEVQEYPVPIYWPQPIYIQPTPVYVQPTPIWPQPTYPYWTVTCGASGTISSGGCISSDTTLLNGSTPYTLTS